MGKHPLSPAKGTENLPNKSQKDDFESVTRRLAELTDVVSQQSASISNIPRLIQEGIREAMSGVQEALTEVGNRVKVMQQEMAGSKAEVGRVKQLLEHTQARQLSERTDPGSAYMALRRRENLIEGLQLGDVSSVHTSAPVPYQLLLQQAHTALMAKLKTVGVDIPVEMLWVQRVFSSRPQPGKPQGPPRIVATVGTDYWQQQIENAKPALRQQGISIRMNLTPSEIANRRFIREHPKFKAAADKMPAGSFPNWRLDACVLGRWGPDAQVWTVEYLASCDPKPMVID